MCHLICIGGSADFPPGDWRSSGRRVGPRALLHPSGDPLGVTRQLFKPGGLERFTYVNNIGIVLLDLTVAVVKVIPFPKNKALLSQPLRLARLCTTFVRNVYSAAGAARKSLAPCLFAAHKMFGPLGESGHDELVNQFAASAVQGMSEAATLPTTVKT